MTPEELYMKRCLELASLGLGMVQPNPMVGAVIVAQQEIIGEGWHHKYGNPHAEVEALHSVKNKNLIAESTLYVNLEPCSHYGKTPPCADAIIAHKIKKVVVGNVDPNEKVNGNGIRKLENAGIEVVTGILEQECRNLNRRFFTCYQKKRPYIILKWAQTADGFMDVERDENGSAPPYWITNQELRTLVHKWRSEEDAILVGYNTWKHDQPQLNTRLFPGKDPKAFVVSENRSITDVPFELLPENRDEMLAILYEKKIQSLIVEGGKKTLEHFLSLDLWDEARVLVGHQKWGRGLRAPEFPFATDEEIVIRGDKIRYVRRYV